MQKNKSSGYMANGYLSGGIVNHDDGALYVLNTELIPELSKISSPDHGVVLLVFFMDYLFLSIITAYMCRSFCSDHRFNIMVSAKRKSPDSVRTFADKIMPWSIYRIYREQHFS